MSIHINKQTHLNSKLQGLSTVLLPSMNHKLPVSLKCAKLGNVFITERSEGKRSRRGMMKKKQSRIRLHNKCQEVIGPSTFPKIQHHEKKCNFILEFNPSFINLVKQIH